MGSLRRVAGLTAVLELAGAEVVEVKLRLDHPTRARDVASITIPPLVRGDMVPEALSWSLRSTMVELDRLQPDQLFCITARAYHPAFAARWPVVVDFVDRLSVSYRDRALILGRSAKTVGFRALGLTAARFERRPLPHGATAIAAGWSDAEALGATWIPITYALPEPLERTQPTHDVIFFGNLVYPPNLEAIEVLSRQWPAIVDRRPGTTLLLAGANASDRVREHVRRNRWALHPDFDRLDDELASARLAVAPLVHASGIQTKVLEAAAYGVPQLLSTAAMSGLGPGFPADVVATEGGLASALPRLLDDTGRLEALGREAREHFAANYTHDAWVSWAEGLLEESLRR